MIRRVRRDVGRDDILGDVAVSGGQVPAVFSDDALDCPCLSKLLQLSAAHARIPEPAGIIPEGQLHHAVGAHVWERIEQDAVDDAEHGARGAYPESEREYRCKREPRAPPQFPRGITKIGDDRAHIIALDEKCGGTVGEILLDCFDQPVSLEFGYNPGPTRSPM